MEKIKPFSNDVAWVPASNAEPPVDAKHLARKAADITAARVARAIKPGSRVVVRMWDTKLAAGVLVEWVGKRKRVASVRLDTPRVVRMTVRVSGPATDGQTLRVCAARVTAEKP